MAVLELRPIYTDVNAFDGVLFIKAGSLDDAAWVEPGAAIWCESKLPWSHLSDELLAMPGNPPA